MNSIQKICLSIVAFVTFIVPGVAGLAQAGQPVEDPILNGEAMVRVREDSTLQEFLTAFNKLWPGTTVIDSIPEHQIYRLQLPPSAVGQELGVVEPQLKQFVNEGAAPVRGKPLRWGELNWLGEAPEGRTGSIVVTSILGGGVEFDSQYPVTILGVDTAHTLSTGAGVVVAILDTGVDDLHPALAGRVISGGFNFVNNTTETADVGDTVDNDSDGLTDEMTGHGTFVAGLVALVAPDAMILPIVVLDSDGVGDSFEIAQGIFYAVDRGVEVINLSLGSTYKSEGIEDAVEYAEDHGIPVVCAGGNQDAGEDFEEFPASSSNGFGIAAVDQNDIRAPFSNYNDKFFLSAPGTSVLTGSGAGEYDPEWSIISTLPGGGYGAWEGTSFAVPLVTGTVALVRAQHPNWTLSGGGPGSLEDVYDALQTRIGNSSVPIDHLNPGYAEELGVGRLNTGGAVALGPPAPALGDLNADGVVDLDDRDLFLTQWGLVHSAADFDGSGLVNEADYNIMIANWTGAPPVPGDVVDSDTFLPPGDGVVDAADLAFLLGAWGVNPGSPADFVSSATFQLPPDGLVNGADLAWLLGNWSQ
jgi:subtilisin family serine protease